MDSAFIFNPNFANNLSLALSVAAVINAEMMYCVLSPLVPSSNLSYFLSKPGNGFSLGSRFATLNSIWGIVSTLATFWLSIFISNSSSKFKYRFGNTTAPIDLAPSLLLANILTLPKRLSTSIPSSLESSSNIGSSTLSSSHKSSRTLRSAALYDIGASSIPACFSVTWLLPINANL